MKLPLLLLCGLTLLLSSCQSTKQTQYERVEITAERTVKNTFQERITYSLFRQNGNWQLTEKSVRADTGETLNYSYGAIDDSEARRILRAATRLSRSETGTFVSFGHENRKLAAHLQLLATMREVALRHGIIQPLYGELEKLNDPNR